MKILIKTLILSILFISVSCLKEDDGLITIAPIQGSTLEPEVGGPSQPNQVWVDLSTGNMKLTKRTEWDLGFHTGEEFAVILNTSALMSASPIPDVTELNQVTSTSVASLMMQVQVANFNPENIQYIDDVRGNYLNNGTVINEINTVYLVNLGYDVYEGTYSPGSAYTAGDLRGWKKIKIAAADTDSYIIQYADLDDEQYQETFIPKEPTHNFTFFSLVSGNVADIQPPKQDWDICFTVFVNEVADLEGNTQGSYIFSDFVISNTMADTNAYEIITDETTLLEDYNNFTTSDINPSLFTSNDHRAIGANWRTVPGAIVRKDRFYVVKDPQGVFFKIRFISMSDEDGYRGYPQFEYEPL